LRTHNYFYFIIILEEYRTKSRKPDFLLFHSIDAYSSLAG